MKRIAWFSKISRAHTLKSSLFSANVLPMFEAKFDIEIFVDDEDCKLLEERHKEFLFCNCKVFHFHRLFERQSEHPFDMFIYHIEDHSSSFFVSKLCSLIPGIMVLHDINLSRLYFSLFSHCTASKDIDELIQSEFGEGIKLGDFYIRKWSIEIFDRLFPLGRKDIQNAGILVLTDPDLNKELLRMNTAYVNTAQTLPPIEEVSESEVSERRISFRSSLGFSEKDFVILLIGDYFYSDNVSSVISTFEKLYWDAKSYSSKERSISFRLVWLVSDPRLLERYSKFISERFEGSSIVKEAIKVISPTEDSVLKNALNSVIDIASASDVLISLRNDTLRSMPNEFWIAYATGVPCICASCFRLSKLPNSGAMFVDPFSQEQISEAVKSLHEDLELRKRIAACAREFVRNELNSSAVAMDIESIIVDNLDKLQSLTLERSDKYQRKAKDLIRSLSCQLDSELFQNWKEILDNGVREFQWY